MGGLTETQKATYKRLAADETQAVKSRGHLSHLIRVETINSPEEQQL